MVMTVLTLGDDDDKVGGGKSGDQSEFGFLNKCDEK